uniref:Uncharacterized protein n=1 Tax=Molossus molossus TaxID=27622 RepID=A0A7J8FYL5_MOLMO|nr:hypothetical protein HJG59_008211 [Molossus molossus]
MGPLTLLFLALAFGPCLLRLLSSLLQNRLKAFTSQTVNEILMLSHYQPLTRSSGPDHAYMGPLPLRRPCPARSSQKDICAPLSLSQSRECPMAWGTGTRQSARPLSPCSALSPTLNGLPRAYRLTPILSIHIPEAPCITPAGPNPKGQIPAATGRYKRHKPLH